MSKQHFDNRNRPSIRDIEKDYHSDVSNVSSEDLVNIVKGVDVDDMDDALFGFKSKKPESIPVKPVSKLPQDDLNTSGKPTSVIKPPKAQQSDFPEGDLLADISLSDDDFFDIGNKSPSISKVQSKIQSVSPKKMVQDSLTKSKKIANLFGLDDENDDITTGTNKNQETAADWLGIKESPNKTAISTPVMEKRDTKTFKTDLSTAKITTDLKIKENNENRNYDLKNTALNKSSSKSMTDILGSDYTPVNPNKIGDNFDLLSDTSGHKSLEIPKEKKSAIFDELFGDSILSQKKSIRKSSILNDPENIVAEPVVPLKTDGVGLVVDGYTPSSSTSRRPNLGRRREINLTPTTPPALTVSQKDWLTSSNVNDTNKSTSQKMKVDKKAQSNPELIERLPVWLGGSGGLPETKSQSQSTQPRKTETIESLPDAELKPSFIIPTEPEIPSKAVEKNVVNTVREVLTSSSDQSQQTALALQRTEVQLLAALELQNTQNSLTAVCARQRNILDNQERQLGQLIRRQTDRQAEVEKQLVTQQERIQQLLEAFAMNLSPSHGDSCLQCQKPEEVATKNLEDNRAVSLLEEEVKKSNLENEELRMKITLIEKQFKFEFECLQSQHRREIEFLENQLSKQNELFEQLNNDCKERIARFKENEAELITQHNERVQRLKYERDEDMKQLVEFHKLTVDQVITFGKLVPTSARETTKISSETWKPLDGNQLSEKEQELVKKEKTLSVLQDKFEKQREEFEKQREEVEDRLEQEKVKNEDIARQLKQEQSQFKYKQQILVQEKKHMDEQYYLQRKMLEEMQDKLMSDQTLLTTEQLTLAEERAKLDALAKLQGISGAVSFDTLQAKAEVQGALEAARSAEIQAVEERRRLKEKERALDNERWKLQEMEEDLVARAQHLDRLMQVSEANQEAGHKALDEAKQIEKKADEKLQEVERRKKDLKEKEQHLMRIQLEIAQEEIRISRKRQQLEHILPPLSSEEALSLQPIKGIIDPKMLILKLRAERELEFISKPKPSATNEI